MNDINYQERLSEIAAAKRRLEAAKLEMETAKGNLEDTREYDLLQQAKAEKKAAEAALEKLLSGVAWAIQPSLLDNPDVARHVAGLREVNARIVSVER